MQFPFPSIQFLLLKSASKERENKGLVFQQILQALWVRQTWNSTPIDELGERAYEGEL